MTTENIVVTQCYNQHNDKKKSLEQTELDWKKTYYKHFTLSHSKKNKTSEGVKPSHILFVLEVGKSKPGMVIKKNNKAIKAEDHMLIQQTAGEVKYN